MYLLEQEGVSLMSHCFSPLSGKHLEFLLACIDRRAYFAEADKCFVVRKTCALCLEGFEEELAAAKEKMVDGRVFVCIKCDPDAVLPAGRGIRVTSEG